MSKAKRQREAEKVAPYYVKIRASRGYGDQPFKVLGAKGSGSQRELELFREGHEAGRFWIYEAHTYRDKDTVKLTVGLRQAAREAACSIGLRKR